MGNPRKRKKVRKSEVKNLQSGELEFVEFIEEEPVVEVQQPVEEQPVLEVLEEEKPKSKKKKSVE